MVTTDPEFVLVMAPPKALLPMALVSCTLEEVSKVDVAIVSVTVATTPLPIVVSLMPYNTQLEVPATVLLQVIVFPAAVPALPTVTTMLEKSVVE
jgi:hypothetical protein